MLMDPKQRQVNLQNQACKQTRNHLGKASYLRVRLRLGVHVCARAVSFRPMR